MFVGIDTEKGEMFVNINSIHLISDTMNDENKCLMFIQGLNDGIIVNEGYESLKDRMSSGDYLLNGQHHYRHLH